MFFPPFCGRPFFFGRGLLLKRESRPQEARTHIRLSWRRRRRRRRTLRSLWWRCRSLGHGAITFLFSIYYPILPLFAFHLLILLGMEENKMAAGPGKGLPSSSSSSFFDDYFSSSQKWEVEPWVVARHIPSSGDIIPPALSSLPSVAFFFFFLSSSVAFFFFFFSFP